MSDLVLMPKELTQAQATVLCDAFEAQENLCGVFEDFNTGGVDPNDVVLMGRLYKVAVKHLSQPIEEK